MIAPVMPTYNGHAARVRAGRRRLADEHRRPRSFLDFGAGIAVNVLGHAHPRSLSPLWRRRPSGCGMSRTSTRSRNSGAWPSALVDATFADTVFFTNSGAEAMAAPSSSRIKMVGASMAGREILAFEGAFHGRSTGAISAAGGAKLTDGLRPADAGLRAAALRRSRRLRGGDRTRPSPPSSIEPIQGEGGIRPVPARRLPAGASARPATEHGALLILDEIQCGMGRTGHLFAHEARGHRAGHHDGRQGHRRRLPAGRVFWRPRPPPRPWSRAPMARPMAATRSAARSAIAVMEDRLDRRLPRRGARQGGLPGPAPGRASPTPIRT